MRRSRRAPERSWTSQNSMCTQRPEHPFYSKLTLIKYWTRFSIPFLPLGFAFLLWGERGELSLWRTLGHFSLCRTGSDPMCLSNPTFVLWNWTSTSSNPIAKTWTREKSHSNHPDGEKMLRAQHINSFVTTNKFIPTWTKVFIFFSAGIVTLSMFSSLSTKERENYHNRPCWFRKDLGWGFFPESSGWTMGVSLLGAWVWSWLGNLRSCKLWRATKKKERKKISWLKVSEVKL